MPLFSVMINGDNVVSIVDGKKKLLGFIITRVVEAGTAIEAERLALAEVREMAEFKRTAHNDAQNPPRLNIEEVEALDDAGRGNARSTGFIFYNPDK